LYGKKIEYNYKQNDGLIELLNTQTRAFC